LVCLTRPSNSLCSTGGCCPPHYHDQDEATVVASDSTVAARPYGSFRHICSQRRGDRSSRLARHPRCRGPRSCAPSRSRRRCGHHRCAVLSRMDRSLHGTPRCAAEDSRYACQPTSGPGEGESCDDLSCSVWLQSGSCVPMATEVEILAGAAQTTSQAAMENALGR